jgi:hypothetical protein
LAARSFAAPSEGLRALIPNPIAVRGGVLVVPVARSAITVPWPATVTLTAEDGSTIEGRVLWIGPAAPEPAAPVRWTDPADRVAIGPLEDPAAPPPGVPHVIARLPRDGSGPLRFGRQTLQPVWVDGPPPPAGAGPMFATQRPDLPRADDPRAHWRWVLLAEVDRMQPPPLARFDEAEALLAEHQADLWRVGLARLDALDARLGAECRALLTRRCSDMGQPFAAWVADPAALRLLLAELLGTRRSAATMAGNIRSWVDTRPKLLAWAEAGAGDAVTLAVVNRSRQPVRCSLAWEGIAPPPPLARTIPPGVLVRVRVPRAPLPSGPAPGIPAPDEPARQTLTITTHDDVLKQTFGRRVTTATPPAAFLPRARGAYSLAEVEARRPLSQETTVTTDAQLRRLRGRWELFVECRRPTSETTPLPPPEPGSDWRSWRGTESITLFIGAAGRPDIVLTIPEQGWHDLARGLNDGTLQIHRRSYDGRWYCRVVLPGSWLTAAIRAGDDPALIGLARTTAAGDVIHTTPSTSAPWRQEPARAAIRLDGWDALP